MADQFRILLEAAAMKPVDNSDQNEESRIKRRRRIIRSSH